MAESDTSPLLFHLLQAPPSWMFDNPGWGCVVFYRSPCQTAANRNKSSVNQSWRQIIARCNQHATLISWRLSPFRRRKKYSTRVRFFNIWTRPAASSPPFYVSTQTCSDLDHSIWVVMNYLQDLKGEFSQESLRWFQFFIFVSDKFILGIFYPCY